MKIKKSHKYLINLQIILEYIAKDKLSASKKFYQKLEKQIKDLSNFPYKYRKSIYFNDKNIRDMIFEGYTIIYEIKNDKIIVLNIFNQNKGLK